MVKPNKNRGFGPFGGRFVPELLFQPLQELSDHWNLVKNSPEFIDELRSILINYAGRPTPLTEVKRFSKAIDGPRIFLKREDLLFTGAHKLNNTLGQCLLAKKMGKTKIIAETGAGQHGVATATSCAYFGLDCVIFMGKKDVERQDPNVKKMRLLGAKVVTVDKGAGTLKEAVNEAMREWATCFDTAHYCIGSAFGPDPYPEMVARFQKVIGEETKEQCQAIMGKNPHIIIACVGGGSNAIGIFAPFLSDKDVKLFGVEGGGKSEKLGSHAARFQGGRPGVLHGAYTYLLQTELGQVAETLSISAGLDYPAVGPQHSQLFEEGRVTYTVARDEEVLEAFNLLTKTEGIIPALESAHALAYLRKIAPKLNKDMVVIVNLSGRGDKDLPQLFANFSEQILGDADE
ncbi:MAG: tryptophan synthase subunit beta [Simkaniaceae bacterium]|nr:tryptophan synthase subunit beta [Simkaniaceae bacterium]